MDNSVEGRFPLLDKAAIALSDSLPVPRKVHVLDEKHTLKPANRALVPARSRRSAASGQFSNADNMAVVGILSTQLVHEHILARPAPPRDVPIKTVIDRLA